jgi:hypothetical protein
VSKDFRLEEDHIKKQERKVVLNIFVGKLSAHRALSKAHAFSRSSIISFAIAGVEMRNRRRAVNAYWHISSVTGGYSAA